MKIESISACRVSCCSQKLFRACFCGQLLVFLEKRPLIGKLVVRSAILESALFSLWKWFWTHESLKGWVQLERRPFTLLSNVADCRIDENQPGSRAADSTFEALGSGHHALVSENVPYILWWKGTPKTSLQLSVGCLLYYFPRSWLGVSFLNSGM